MRILFISDLHGSDSVFKKSLMATQEFDVSVLILAGDLTARYSGPIRQKRDNSLKTGNKGRHKVILDSEGRSKDEIAKTTSQRAIEQLEYWSELIIAQIDLTKVVVFITPGNDDSLEIDEVLQSFETKGIYSNLISPYEFSTNEMITLDYSNTTPWNTARELPEEELSKMIQTKVDQLENPEKAIFNFHCPPFRTKIDLAFEFNNESNPTVKKAVINRIHVGSTSVRDAISNHQPLISLHGHIHEAPGEDRIGKTLCLNPGSEYWHSILHGYIVDIDQRGCISDYFRIRR